MLFRRQTRSTPKPGIAPVPSEVPEPTAGGRTLIGRNTRIAGKLYGDGPVVVRGSLKGTVAIRGGLSVRGGARLEADVQAHSIDVAGEVRGRINAGSRVTLADTGAFEGEIETPVLDLSPGSILRGRARVAGLQTKERRSSH
jgi:cytoskeletal protein CcmA (bactofilin family)